MKNPELYIGAYSIGHYRLKIRQPDPSLCLKLRRTDGGTLDCVAARYSFIRVLNPVTRFPDLGPFYTNQNHWTSDCAAACHRYACRMPEGDLLEQTMFMKYAKEFIKKAWPLENTVRVEDIPPYREFLEKYSNYPGPRKRALLELRESLFVLSTEGKEAVSACKGFIKFECYDEPKAPRGINSPSDMSKTLLAAL